MTDYDDAVNDDGDARWMRPADPRDRFAAEDLIDYGEMRSHLAAERVAWPEGSAMHRWADQLEQIAAHNEAGEAAWQTWARPHEQGVEAGADLGGAVDEARVALLDHEYWTTALASEQLAQAQGDWELDRARNDWEEDTRDDDGWGRER